MKVVGDKHVTSERVRELLQPAEVDHSNLPVWVRERVKAAMKRGDLDTDVHAKTSAKGAFEHATRTLGARWADHVGRIKIDGVQYLVSEPYAEQINTEMIAQLKRFCDVLGVVYVFCANSQWFPGRTIRIIVGEARPKPH